MALSIKELAAARRVAKEKEEAEERANFWDSAEASEYLDTAFFTDAFHPTWMRWEPNRIGAYTKAHGIAYHATTPAIVFATFYKTLLHTTDTDTRDIRALSDWLSPLDWDTVPEAPVAVIEHFKYCTPAWWNSIYFGANASRKQANLLAFLLS